MYRRAYLSIAGLLLAACQSETTTGVRLAIHYDASPERLRVLARADDGSIYGPELLPDPPRPLAAGGESVLLRLTDALHDHALALEVEGLDSNSGVVARGKQSVRVVGGAIVDSEVRLTPALGCPPDHMLLSDGSCAPRELADAAPPEPSADAGSLDGGCGDRCTDASRPVAVAPDDRVPEPETGSPTSDAGCGPPRAVCGDGICCASSGENAGSCSDDCAPVCGDAICSPSETPCVCAGDCGMPMKCELTCAAGTSCDWSCAGADECRGKCSSGSTCSLDCTDANNCNAECAADAVCKLDCSGANNCRSKCGPNSDCTIDCASANNCDEIECHGGAACTVLCGSAENCAFKRCTGTQTECADGTLVCGRECP
jgi:hypothetical protein